MSTVLCEESGWHPRDVLLVAGALQYSEYDYFRQQIVRSILAEKDNRLDAERDHVFTDWEAGGPLRPRPSLNKRNDERRVAVSFR